MEHITSNARGLGEAECRSIYATAVYVARIDGRIQLLEVGAARAVAEELDLVDGEPRPGRILMDGPRDLDELALSALSGFGAYVAYATAAWMAQVDEHEHGAERAVLMALQRRLGLPDDAVALLEMSAAVVRAHGRVSQRTEYRALLSAIEDWSGQARVGT